MGTIRERAQGHFEIRAYVGRSPSGQPRYVQETYVHHRKDGGIAAARARMKVLESKAAKARSTTTLGALLGDWLAASRRRGRAPNTLAAYERRVRVISDALGDIELGRLTAKDLDLWYGQLIDEGKSPADVMAYHRVISAALTQGEKWDEGIRNVAKRAEPPRVPRASTSTPTAERVRVLIEMAGRSKSPWMAEIITWAALTGMRRGEICGLRWDSIDWEAGEVDVSRSVWQINRQVGEKDTKSHQARRVAVGDVGLAILERRRREAAEDAQTVDLELEPDGFVWSSDLTGRAPLRPDRITQAFERLCRRAERPAAQKAAGTGRDLSIDERWDYRLHDLRHYSATELLQAGVPLHDVSRRLGHAKASTTSDIYGHGRDEGDRRAAKVLGKSLASPKRKAALPKA